MEEAQVFVTGYDPKFIKNQKSNAQPDFSRPYAMAAAVGSLIITQDIQACNAYQQELPLGPLSVSPHFIIHIVHNWAD